MLQAGASDRAPPDARTPHAVLEITGLVKHYGDVVALDGVSFTARPGRLLGFLGPNGSGKTTTMRAVFGLVHVDAGEVTWRGSRITAAQRLRFGYMPEQRGLYPRMPCGPQLRYLGQLHGLDRRRADEAARRWLDALGLADRFDDSVSQLSHGNQQRVQLASALVHEPELMVLDEPFSGLDPLGVAAMSEVLAQRAADGATVVFSSHQLDLVEGLCDDVVIVADGRDRLAGTLEEVRATSDHRRAEVRLPGGGEVTPPPGVELLGTRDGVVQLRVPTDVDARELLDRLAPDGGVERFALQPPSLSEIFREVVGASVAELESDAGEVVA
jgi:ABC-2 type transport system ATP-binding protein